MGVYRAAIVTENGQNLIAQALANERPLIFTSAKTSSYSYPVGTDVPALTGLQDVVQSVLPFDSKVLGGNVAQVSVRFDNDGVDQTYRIETIGLYAKIEGGAETLFSVTQATTPDEMPVQSDISPSAYIYNIQHTVQNASQITLTVNPAGTATVQDIMDIETPEFDDSGTVEGISSFPSFLETMKSKMNFFQFFRNLKAGLQFVLHTGQIVNNCVTDNSSLPLSAAQGKVLKDLYTQLYSDSQTISSRLDGIRVGCKKSDSATVQLEGFTGQNVDGISIQATNDQRYFMAGKFNGTWNNTVELAKKDDLNTCAQKEFTPGYGRWDTGIQNAYFKMKKHSGDNFLPFLKMSTDDGAWVIGVHSSLNRLVFRYYANETGAGVSVYEFDPNASPKTV